MTSKQDLLALPFEAKLAAITSLYEDWVVAFHAVFKQGEPAHYGCRGTHDWDSYGGSGPNIEAALDDMLEDMKKAGALT